MNSDQHPYQRRMKIFGLHTERVADAYYIHFQPVFYLFVLLLLVDCIHSQLDRYSNFHDRSTKPLSRSIDNKCIAIIVPKFVQSGAQQQQKTTFGKCRHDEKRNEILYCFLDGLGLPESESIVKIRSSLCRLTMREQW
jgi:hypothetical protein